MRDDLGVGFACEREALRLQFAAQFMKVLDDAVVHDRHPVAGVRMGVALAWSPVGGPAGVADPGGAGERRTREPLLEVLKLALRAQSRQATLLERRDSGGIVAPVFQPLQRVDELIGDRLAPENSDYSAHSVYRLRAVWRLGGFPSG